MGLSAMVFTMAKCRADFSMKISMSSGLLALLLAGAPVHAQLGLAEAEQLALNNDPMTQALEAKAAAWRELSVASGQLPDPKLKLGLMNLPTDSFNRAQEPMTQLQVGVQQMFPRGRSLELRQQRDERSADVEDAKAREQRLKVLLAVRKDWLESYYWVRAGEVIRRHRVLFRQLVDITRSRYASGGKNQQDVVQAELELEMLSDRENQILTMEEKARAGLTRWIGADQAQQALPGSLPQLPAPAASSTIAEGLLSHPLMLSEQATVAVRQTAVALAREAYKPGWALDVSYGQREERADFLSAMVMLDLPLFTDKRQDRRLSASQQQFQAAMQSREMRLRELQQRLARQQAEWSRLGERVTRYQQTLLPQTRTNSEAAINAYQSDRGDFTMLMRARITELNTRLQALRLSVDRAKAQAELLYLGGEQR